NVLLGRDGRAKLGDFGLALGMLGREATQSDVVRGAPGFVAPEVARGAPAGPPVDVWALGATLHALVAGRPPIRRFQRAHAVAHGGAPIELDAAVTGEVRAIVERCLARAPHDRASAAAIAEHARAALGAEAAAARTALAAWARAIGARERGALDDLFFS